MHAHSHHSGESGHHHHGGLGESATGILAAAIVATLLLVVVEFVAGYAGRSIALVSDGIHNLTDAPTLVISWLAMRWALRPATPEKTYGYHRAGILAAFVNATVLTLAALVLIGHDIGLMAQFVHRLAVMYAGRLVEIGTIRDVLTRPRHPYTRALIASIPRLRNRGVLGGIQGVTPSLRQLPRGCAFHPRCPSHFERCLHDKPLLDDDPGEHHAACHLREAA